MRAFNLILILLFTLSLNAQTFLFKGTVLDSLSGAGIEYANVYIESPESGIIAFSNTNAVGQYEIVTNVKLPDTVNITASVLGFKAKTFFLRTASNKVFIQDFQLSQEDFLLEEAIVKEESLPIIRNNDTTRYKVSAFIDSTEYSVEDVLKKLPGIEVSDVGGISINGKPIAKVMIEGDDLFGSNYTVGTRNLRAGVLDEVEVVDNYEDNPVLKDINLSDDVILNLKIKESKKNVISGGYTLGLGYGDEIKNYFHGNLFSFSKKSKTVLLGNINNIGFNPIGEVELLSNNASLIQSIEKESSKPLSLFNDPEFQRIGLPDKFTFQKNTNIVNFNQVFNLSNELDIKLSGTYFKEKGTQNYFYDNVFFSTADTLTFKETTESKKKNDLSDFVLSVNYFSKNNKNSIKLYSNYISRKEETNQLFERIENSLKRAIGQDNTSLPTSFYNALEYTSKVSKYSIFQITSKYKRQKNNQYLALQDDNYADYFDLETLNQIAQKSKIAQTKSELSFRYLYSKRITLNVELLYSDINTSIFSNTTLDERLQPNNSTEIYGNDISIKQSIPMLKSIFRKKIAKNIFSGGIELSHSSFKGDKFKSQKRYLFNSFLQLKTKLDSYSLLNFKYSYKEQFAQTNTLFEEFIFNDYQTLKRGTFNLLPEKEHRLSGSYSYDDVLNTFSFNIKASFSKSANSVGNDFNYTRNLFEQRLFNPISTTNWRGGALIQKLFYNIDSRFLLRYLVNSTSTNSIINDELQDITFYTNEIYLDYGSAFDIPINFFFTNSLVFSDFSSSLGAKNKLITLSSKCKVVYKPNKKFNINIAVYNIYNQSKSIKNSFLNSEINASFIFNKKKRNELSIGIVNLTNQNKFDTKSLGNYYTRDFSLDGVPRFFVIKWDSSL